VVVKDALDTKADKPSRLPGNGSRLDGLHVETNA
jgi:hypothetical protein